MLQNGLIILSFIWSLMRMVNFSQDSCDWRDFPIVNFPYLSSNIPGFSVQRIYSGFKVIETWIFFTETSDYF